MYIPGIIVNNVVQLGIIELEGSENRNLPGDDHNYKKMNKISKNP